MISLWMTRFQNPTTPQNSIRAPQKILENKWKDVHKSASLRHLCRYLQIFAEIAKMSKFSIRNGCKDGRVRTGVLSTICLQCGRLLLCSLWGWCYWRFASSQRLRGVFAYVCACLCMLWEKNIAKTIQKYTSCLMYNHVISWITYDLCRIRHLSSGIWRGACKMIHFAWRKHWMYAVVWGSTLRSITRGRSW